jgi:hypothetical protein
MMPVVTLALSVPKYEKNILPKKMFVTFKVDISEHYYLTL